MGRGLLMALAVIAIVAIASATFVVGRATAPASSSSSPATSPAASVQQSSVSTYQPYPGSQGPPNQQGQVRCHPATC
jgi:hypothetical protein